MQKISIKREQSQAGLSFAERKNFRPKVKRNKLFLLLALLLTAATGAWATDVYLVGNGTGNWLNDAIWDPGVAGNKMTEQNGVYSITFNDVDANSELLFKFAINGTWDVNYGCTSWDANELNKTLSNIEEFGNNIAFGLTEKADVTISFNLSELTYMISTKGMKVGDDAATTYTVSLKEGVKDAGNWSIEPKEGLKEGDPVTLTYNGRLKVKGVKATSDAAAASVPDGALSGVFSVSASKKVYFSKGNLRYASSKWSFFDNQYDYYDSHSADAWDKFGWSTAATTYGMNTSDINSDYFGDFVDWGATMGTGWFTLSSDEWTYLFNTRTVNGGTGDGKSYTRGQSVNGKLGVVIYPDNYTGEVYSGSDWATFESAGCVFLPAAGIRSGSSVYNQGAFGYYWSASPNGTDKAYEVYFRSGTLSPASNTSRYNASCVRLVREVATSDAEEAKPAATVTTAPTGAAIVGAGKTTALVSGGVAEGGTLWYAVTTTNTKPTSTDGFSDAVPTAQSITASGKVYVWYYVKGDDTHSDSEIEATAIEVPVADIVWDATNVTDLTVFGTDPYEKEGVKLSGNAHMIHAEWIDAGEPTMDGIAFNADESGGYTFTAPTGKAFSKIEMTLNGSIDWESANLGTGWAFNAGTVTWKGSAAASTVDLLTGADEFYGAPVKSIAFYLSE